MRAPFTQRLLAVFFILAGCQHHPATSLQPGQHVIPQNISATELVFKAPAAARVELWHSGNGWTAPVNAARKGDLWVLPVTQLGLPAGRHEFKFVADGTWEEGPNHRLNLGTDGKPGPLPSLYLTWRRDPTTTMVVCWDGDDPTEQPLVQWRARGDEAWSQSRGRSAPLPHTGRTAHQVELTGLAPGRRYEFRAGPQAGTHSFVTMPATLKAPLRFVEGGDVYGDERLMDQMNRFAASLDPAFVVLGGDLGYENGQPELAGRWLRFMQSLSQHLRAPDGRMIPVLAAVGNHEVRREDQNLIRPGAMPKNSRDRRGLAPLYFASFPFPGDPGYNVLDCGNYLSLVFLDTNHLNLVAGRQSAWLARTLEARKNRPHLLPVYHVPAYPSVRAYDGEVNQAIRRAWVPLFEKAGVRLSFEHHDHSLKVTPPIRSGRRRPDGIVFVGDGSWGVKVRQVHDAASTWYLNFSRSANGLNEVTLEPGRRTVRVLTANGREVHRVEQTLDAD
ncbi:MAG: fibronectin type III domain-containing protein [Chthoniobacterales bacterium]